MIGVPHRIRLRAGERPPELAKQFGYVGNYHTTKKPTQQLFREKRLPIPVVDHLGGQGGTRLVVQSLGGSGLVGRGPLSSEFGRGEFTMGGVGSVGVVVAAPVFDDHAGFPQRVEAPRVE